MQIQKKIHIFCLLLLGSGTLLFGQKTVYFYEQEVLKAIPSIEQKIAYADSIQKNYTEQIKTNNDKINTKLEELLKSYNITSQISKEELLKKLSEKDKARFEILQEEQKLYEKIAQTLNKELENIYNEKVGKLIKEATLKIENYCKSQKIDVLYKLEALRPTMGYFNNKLDITEELKKLVK